VGSEDSTHPTKLQTQYNDLVALNESEATMVRFEGDRDFARAPDELWTKLTDARFLAQCIPDVVSVTEAEPDHAALTLRPGFAFVRGTLEVTLRVVEAVAPTSARMVLVSKGIGSSSMVEADLALTPRDGGGTRVHWIAEVKELGGLLKLVPQGLIRGAAQKVVGDVWSAIEAKMGGN
jgi:carbon monoxide dehydrogenase subunit G